MPDDMAVSELQRSRLGRAVGVILTCAVAWAGFGFYYVLSGRPVSGGHCLFEGCVGFVCAAVAFQRADCREKLSSFYVAMIVFGLTIESYLIGLETSLSPMFYCAAVLVAALTIGINYALRWSVVCVFLILAINYGLPELLPDRPDPTRLDRALAYTTLLGVISACACIGESKVDVFAKRLEETSEKLRNRTIELDRLAAVDLLTGLPNRRQFHQDTDKLTSEDAPNFALLLIDLNSFKLINDRFGHASGDVVLKSVSNCLQEATQDLATAYRLGGDEFVVLIPADEESDLPTVARLIAERIVDNAHSQSLGVGSSKVGISIGLAIFPDHATHIDELVSYADKAMYEAKTGDQSVVVFAAKMAREIEEKRLLVEGLDEAIQNQDFVLYYQPQVEATTNRIVGVEALVRWARGDEIVEPDIFIPILESNGKIVEVGEWVLREACRQLGEWRNQGFDLRISVNATPLQIRLPCFAETVLTVLEKYDLPTDVLNVEVTESLLLERGEHERSNMETLTERGVRFSIDDFGTGYSSLSYLKRLRVDELKIDRSFIKDIPDSDDGVIAETIITLAKQLNKTVIAEGVETETQLAFLEARGCDKYQGYLFSEPLLAEECGRMLKSELKQPTIS